MVIRERPDRKVSGGASGQSSGPEIGLTRTWTYIVARSSASHLMVSRATSAETVAQPVPQDPFLADVLSCLHTLSRQQRTVLLADLAAGGTASATVLAKRMHTTRNTIYVARATGRKALRAELLKRGHVLGYGPGWSMSFPEKEG
jgi:DNA-directed RNA polymerase specialized sigma24 family protein